jgi:hypothetical protein
MSYIRSFYYPLAKFNSLLKTYNLISQPMIYKQTDHTVNIHFEIVAHKFFKNYLVLDFNFADCNKLFEAFFHISYISKFIGIFINLCLFSTEMCKDYLKYSTIFQSHQF